MRVCPALVVLADFIRDGSFLKLYSLGVQELVSRPLLQIVAVQKLFLRRYFLLRPKCLHEAPVERRGAIVCSLCIVRCRCMVIFWVLG